MLQSIPLRQTKFVAKAPQINLGLRQTTLSKAVSCQGIGVHTGQSASVTFRPALADTGIVFFRSDINNKQSFIPARWDNVSDTAFCTKITNETGVSVSTIEHVVAAFSGMGIHNVLVEVNGPEIPIMDGSSVPFVKMIEQAKIKILHKTRKNLRVLKSVRVEHGQSVAMISPYERPLVTMDFDANGRLAPHRWTYAFSPEEDSFKDLLSQARTFGFYSDAQKLWDMGLSKGASLDNTVVLDANKEVMNAEGLRCDDEFVRHKMLDALGDLALSGFTLIGHFHGVNTGHMLNNLLLRQLLADSSAWAIEEQARASLNSHSFTQWKPQSIELACS